MLKENKYKSIYDVFGNYEIKDYNDLYKNAISRWEDGKMGKWEKCYKDFSNGHTFSDKQTTANFTPLFLKILQIQQHEAWQT